MSMMKPVKLQANGFLAQAQEGDVIPVEHGGTGSTSLQGALNNILPDMDGQDGKFLKTNGVTAEWAISVQIEQGTGTSTTAVMSQNATTDALSTKADVDDSRFDKADTAYGWGDHAQAGYVTTDTTYTASTGLILTDTAFSADFGTEVGKIAQGNDSRIINGQTAYDWGNHADEGYVTTDTTYTASTGLNLAGTAFSVKYGTTAETSAQGNDSRILNGQTAYDWGDHAQAGYTTSDTQFTAGTGLNLSGTEFSVKYGTTAGTAVQGNDSRIVGAVQTSRKINGQMLDNDVQLTAADVGAVSSSIVGEANGVAPLDSNKLIPADFLPSYVDDVVEYDNLDAFPTTEGPGLAEKGKIYVAKDTNAIYRWSGSAYIEIGTATSTADEAYKLATAYKINGTDFDGTQNITTAQWGTSRQITIGDTAKAVDGSTAVSWSLAEIGAVDAAHVTSAISGKVDDTVKVIAGTGVTGGGALSGDVTINVAYGTTAGTAAQGNDSRIVNGQTAFGWGDHSQAGYLMPSDLGDDGGIYSAGTGLSLTDGEFSVKYGTAAGTAVQGNDSRVNNGQTAFGWGDHAGAGYVKTDTTYTAGTGLSLTSGAFAVDFGTTAGTVAQGNDSRIVNGQTAFGWGNHSSAGYVVLANLSADMQTFLALSTKQQMLDFFFEE